MTGKAEKLKMFTSRTQFERLVKELKKNPALDNYRNVTDSGNFKDRWDELAIVLNNLGTAKRLGDGWIKVKKKTIKYSLKKKLYKPILNLFIGLAGYEIQDKEKSMCH